MTWAGYPGSKAAGGVAERIAGLFPPHRVYVEGFLGHGAVMRKKRRATVNIGIDKDPAIIAKWEAAAAAGNDGAAGVNVICADALDRLPSLPELRDPDAVVYLDPPYLLDSRTSGERLYACEFETAEAHNALFGVARAIPCRVAISHYPHPLYLASLQDWRRVEFPAMTRGGVRTECVWLNFPQPTEFHDPFFANVGHRERFRVKRRARRWLARLDRLPAAERAYIFEALRSRVAVSGVGIQTPDPALVDRDDVADVISGVEDLHAVSGVDRCAPGGDAVSSGGGLP